MNVLVGFAALILAAPLVAVWGGARFFKAIALVRRIQRTAVTSLAIERHKLVFERNGTRHDVAIADIAKAEGQLANYVGFSKPRGNGLLLVIHRKQGPTMELGVPRYTTAIADAVVQPLLKRDLLVSARPVVAQRFYPNLGNLVELAAAALWCFAVYRLVT